MAATTTEKAARLNEEAANLSERLEGIAAEARDVAEEAATLANQTAALGDSAGGVDPFIFGLTVFALACFVGYYVVWRVTPALHAPLMSVANAISGVVIVGALIAAGPALIGTSKILGFLAVILASVNIFGGFIITHRMLDMFKKKG
ncbi:MAG TPA: NAD(P) transhydrogenase subunit alpha [Alphaproteobacteria bacterium]|nr:NAD(P) transhydrogenase subunit alpha [Alphaproteobacteria bacterium]